MAALVRLVRMKLQPVLSEIAVENSSTSICHLGQQLSISKSSHQQILTKDLDLLAYKIK